MPLTHASNLVFPILLATLMVKPASAACTADSGVHQQHLLELYTSEGCSSCPPADRYLSKLKGEDGVWPLAFHVDYWDHLGWPDRFAQHAFSERQRVGASRNGSRFVYTPQFVLDGRDWRQGWGKAPWQDDRHEPANRLTLRIDPEDSSTVMVSGTWSGQAGQIFMAVSENSLQSQVRTGENAGRRLNHDFVVRRLYGPAVTQNGRFAQAIKLQPDWKRKDLAITAFVAQSDDGAVSQAIGSPICLP